jgi:hypothetical protein
MASKTMNDYLEMDGDIAFKIGIYNKLSNFSDSAYASICGGFVEGVYQWATHNIRYIDEVANKKYTGWEIHFNDDTIRKVYIENWVMESKPKDWKHAKNLFNKYLKVKNEAN